ncbi:unnamed protein product [Brassica rapa subsp. narinosa]
MVLTTVYPKIFVGNLYLNSTQLRPPSSTLTPPSPPLKHSQRARKQIFSVKLGLSTSFSRMAGLMSLAPVADGSCKVWHLSTLQQMCFTQCHWSYFTQLLCRAVR